jgi:hypothetical protein
MTVHPKFKWTIYAITLLFFNIELAANERPLSEKERTDTRDLIVVGVVRTKQKVKAINNYFDLWYASVEIKKIEKQSDKVFSPNSELRVYFNSDRSPNRGRNAIWPLLEIGKTYKIYAVMKPIDISNERLPVIMMTTDVVPVTQ